MGQDSSPLQKSLNLVARTRVKGSDPIRRKAPTCTPPSRNRGALGRSSSPSRLPGLELEDLGGP